MNNYIYKNGVFTIRNFDRQKTFSSFLPGIAGENGIPIWSFYCNRGQGLASFGIQNKDNPILEFFPANTAYQYISTYGFRSFIKINGKVYEPFGVSDNNIERNMYIEYSQFKIEEVNKELGFRYVVTYFVVPKENFGALGRYVTVENISGDNLEFELLDGQSTLLPVGVTNSTYKEMSNLMRSWMDVYNLENNIPFFTMRASTEDSAEINDIKDGNFFVSVDDSGKLLKPIVDASLIFEHDTSLRFPVGFQTNNIGDLLSKEQVTVNKVPCAFTTATVKLKVGEDFNISTLVGKSESLEILNEKVAEFTKKGYLLKKLDESKNIINHIINNVNTKSSSDLFDSYIKQCYLDNLLRGGYPVVFGKENNKKVHYLYARKHGDPERDYNFFDISPEYYSQGNGNFRDVNQNRRNDVLLDPEVEFVNLELFYSLIQLDGYNPLEVKGYTYSVTSKDLMKIKSDFNFVDDTLSKIFEGKFTVGEISKKLSEIGVSKEVEEEFLNTVLGEYATQNIEAKYGEGYWSDHFTYNQDLLENYLLVYPDKEEEILFGRKILKTYESAEIVLPRKDKYLVTEKGEIRQYNALKLDKERIEKLNLDVNGTNWLKDSNGELYTSTLYEKLLLLAVTKFLNIDPSGIGVEMEANKPGWNDAMNGLPGLIGSGVSETIELKRIVEYLLAVNHKYKSNNESLDLLMEFGKVVTNLLETVTNEREDITYWDKANTIKEKYREDIRLGISFEKVTFSFEKITTLLTFMLEKLEIGIEKAKKLGKGVIPTFLYHKAKSFKSVENDLQITDFEVIVLPYFLEAPARYMKQGKNKFELLELYENIRKSDIYDKGLNMYKTSESIDGFSNEIGRIRAFTPGWQERESIFLHMTYKYMLGLIKAGLYENFFEEIKTNFVCFRNPEEYGRNPVENSSFLASSVNPDKNIRGQGLVARLSGSTSEMLSIWSMMMVGKTWFTYEDELKFELKPIIPNWLFEEGKLSFKLFSKIQVTYINENNKDTYLEEVEVYKYIVDGELVIGKEIKGELARKVRNKEVKEILAYLK